MKIFGKEINISRLARKSGAQSFNPEDYRPVNVYAGGIERVTSDSLVRAFYDLPEVSFPILYITSRMKNAEVVLCRMDDDSEVWGDSTVKLYGLDRIVSDNVHRILSRPNYLMGWGEFVDQYFFNRYISGNDFVVAVGDADKRYMRANFHVLPSQSVRIVRNNRDILTVEDISDAVSGYWVTASGSNRVLSTDDVLFTRDVANLKDATDLKGRSRLEANLKCINNLYAVYAARNAIYSRRGALGALVNMKKADGTSVAMTKAERDALLTDLYNTYGFGENQVPYMVLKHPVDFIKMGGTISELEPFRETAMDAAQISAAFQVKKELLPRDDNSTFSNQEQAEISCYNDMVIPEYNQFISDFGKWLGIEEDGFYLKAKWDSVAILQQSDKDRAESDRNDFANAMAKFNAGLCTLNDVAAACGMEAHKESIYNKTRLQMSSDELAIINGYANKPENQITGE